MQAHTAAQVDRIDPVEDGGGFVGGIAGWNLDAGVVEGKVEPAEGVDGRLHHGRHAVLVGDVTTNTKDPVAGGCQLVCGGTQRGLVDVCDDDRGPGLGERACGGKAHAGASTGHECYLPSEVVDRVHGFSFCCVVYVRGCRFLDVGPGGLPEIGGRGRSGPMSLPTSGDQLRSIVTWKLSSWCSISSIVVSNRPMRTMPFQ